MKVDSGILYGTAATVCKTRETGPLKLGFEANCLVNRFVVPLDFDIISFS